MLADPLVEMPAGATAVLAAPARRRLDAGRAVDAPSLVGRAQPDVADLDLIIPVLNEERRLPATLAMIGPHLRDRPWTTRLIVVDNGSVDATSEVVDRAAAAGLAAEVIGCRTPGKGAAVRAGVAHSRARWVGYCDADLSTPVETIDEGVHQLQRGFDVVIASRRCTGARFVVAQPVARRVAGRLFRAATAPLTGPVADTQCGMKLFDGPAARELFAQCELSGFAFDVEVLARARRSSLRMIEVPIEWTHQDGSTLHVRRDGMRVAREIVAVHRNLRRSPMAAKVG
jgi:dolichyl-phosphate beta-glucosyltransferase